MRWGNKYWYTILVISVAHILQRDQRNTSPPHSDKSDTSFTTGLGSTAAPPHMSSGQLDWQIPAHGHIQAIGTFGVEARTLQNLHDLMG